MGYQLKLAIIVVVQLIGEYRAEIAKLLQFQGTVVTVLRILLNLYSVI